MGTMACYQETCPHCGKVPPSRQKEINKYHENLAFLENEVKYLEKWPVFRILHTIYMYIDHV